MRDLSPIQVLGILAHRMEKRAVILDRMQLSETNATAYELREFAKMARRAIEYLRKKRYPH